MTPEWETVLNVTLGIAGLGLHVLFSVIYRDCCIVVSPYFIKITEVCVN